MRIAIFGTGGMGREIHDIATAASFETVFVVDEPQGPILGVPTISPKELRSDDELVLALGSSLQRRTVAERLAGKRFANLSAITSRVAPSASIGEGSVFCDYSVVNNSAVIGRHFQANTFAQVSHDCIIGDFVTFAPRVTCNGWVEISDDVFVGAGAVIRNGSSAGRLRVGKGAVIGMGAVVVGDIAPGTTVVGNPARPMADQ